MWKPWELFTRSHDHAIANARGACTELSRLRVERTEADLFVARLAASRTTVNGRSA